MRLVRLVRDLVPAGGAARRLTLLTLVQSSGSGLFLTSSAVFFVKVVGLRPAVVGLGLSLAGLAGFLAAFPVGRLADRYGPRRLLAADHAVLAALFAGYPFVRGVGPFIAVASLISVGEICASPLRSALAHALFPAGEAVRVRAQMRGAFNLGFMLGAAVAGVALAKASPAAFVAVTAGTAAAQATCVLLVSSIRIARPPAGGDRSRSALRDLRFLLVAVTSGLLELHTTVLALGIPLWIVTHTRVPISVNSLLIVANTLIVLLFQVPLSRGAQTPAGASRLQRRAGALLATACLVYLASQDLRALPGALVVGAGTVVLSMGEIYQSAGGWGLAFELPPPGRQAEYQAVFALGRGVQQAVGPALVTALVVGAGRLGWLVLAAVFIVLGLVCVQLVPAVAAGSGRHARDPGWRARHRRRGRGPARA